MKSVEEEKRKYEVLLHSYVTRYYHKFDTFLNESGVLAKVGRACTVIDGYEDDLEVKKQASEVAAKQLTEELHKQGYRLKVVADHFEGGKWGRRTYLELRRTFLGHIYNLFGK